MRKCFVSVSLLLVVIVAVSFSKENLRSIYSRPAAEWPRPFVDDGVNWTELGVLPVSPIKQYTDSLRPIIELGKVLFFDERLSGSGKISCATCHQPELHWTDGKEKSIGHEGAVNKRNAPTIQNTWFYKRLFWDGRSKDLQDQAFAPINSETEMHSEMPDLMRKLRNIKGYKELFRRAYGDENIDPDRLTEAIAIFEKTVSSRKSRFDDFLEGRKNALSKKELKGLHLFRTKARCMNCHHGPLFTDNLFHNNGFHLNGNPQSDQGLYLFSHNESDIGKFKTPSLRDVAHTGPWMHNGMMKTLRELLAHYNKGADGNGGNEKAIRMLYLNIRELEDLEAFLKAISASPADFQKPVLPQ